MSGMCPTNNFRAQTDNRGSLLLGLFVGRHVYSASQPRKGGAGRLPNKVALSIDAQADADPTEAGSVRIFDCRLINDSLLH